MNLLTYFRIFQDKGLQLGQRQLGQGGSIDFSTGLDVNLSALLQRRHGHFTYQLISQLRAHNLFDDSQLIIPILFKRGDFLIFDQTGAVVFINTAS